MPDVDTASLRQRVRAITAHWSSNDTALLVIRDLPALLDRIEELEAALRAVRPGVPDFTLPDGRTAQRVLDAALTDVPSKESSRHDRRD